MIGRSGGVVFMEQLAPILNPREAPPEWYRESAAGDFSRNTGANGSITIEAVGGDAPVLRLLLELNGIPEVRHGTPSCFDVRCDNPGGQMALR